RASGTFASLAVGRGSLTRAVGVGVRRILIAGQVAVAMVLLFGAGLMFRTVARIAGADLGFRTDGVVAASTLLPDATYADSSARRRVMDRVLERIAQTDGVRSAAAAYPLPFGPAGRFPVLSEGAAVNEESAPKAGVFTVSPGYFATMDVRLRAGRT